MFEGNNYFGDLQQNGISNFVLRNEAQWAYSSTGVYLGNADAGFIAQNTFSLNITGPDYYQNAINLEEAASEEQENDSCIICQV